MLAELPVPENPVRAHGPQGDFFYRVKKNPATNLSVPVADRFPTCGPRPGAGCRCFLAGAEDVFDAAAKGVRDIQGRRHGRHQPPRFNRADPRARDARAGREFLLRPVAGDAADFKIVEHPFGGHIGPRCALGYGLQVARIVSQ